MTVVFHPLAAMELEEAVRYYNEVRAGLGLEFAEEVRAAILRIREYPESGAVLSANTRRCLAHRFPFGIIYQVAGDALVVIAVAHLQRRPGYWKKRRY